MTNAINATGWYGTTFKAWQAKNWGPKPTNEQLAAIHDLGARPGKQAMACAMATRECGVTGSQIVQVCGAPQLNKMRGFEADKLFKRVPTSPDDRNHTVYKYELTGKANTRIEATRKRAAAAAAESAASAPVKAAGKPKVKPATKAPAKPKAPATAPTAHVTPVPVNELVISDQPVDTNPQA